MSQDDKEKSLTQVVALVLMAVATLGSAWAGFQTGLWNGTQTFRLADAAKLSRLSSENSMLANQQRNLDANIFEEYAKAVSVHNVQFAAFLKKRMRPEFRPAMEAWLATMHLQSKDAAPSPFAMPEYQLRAQQEASDQERQANALRDQALQASHTVDNYTLAILLFTSALFVAGLVHSFKSDWIRWVTIGFSVVSAAWASFMLTTLPIARR